MVDKRIREMMDACRPGSEDLADDTMQELRDVIRNDASARELYDRTQSDDRAIHAALHQVAVPAGLASRIVERVGSNTALAGDQAAVEDEPRVQCEGRSLRRFHPLPVGTRRGWLTAAAAVSAAVLAGVFLVPRLFAPTIDASELCDGALGWLDAIGTKWNEDLSQAPEDLRMNSQYVSASPSGWQAWRMPQPLDRDSTAYQLFSSFSGGQSAVLFVAKGADDIPNLSASPPREPLGNTAGRASGAWRDEDRLYVLVVPGGKGQYQNCLRYPQLAALY